MVPDPQKCRLACPLYNNLKQQLTQMSFWSGPPSCEALSYLPWHLLRCLAARNERGRCRRRAWMVDSRAAAREEKSFAPGSCGFYIYNIINQVMWQIQKWCTFAWCSTMQSVRGSIRPASSHPVVFSVRIALLFGWFSSGINSPGNHDQFNEFMCGVNLETQAIPQTISVHQQCHFRRGTTVVRLLQFVVWNI